ncbi:hypothetical protein KUF71_013723 [Frankliniella fusca]|uniref:Uncharacterized protein n=1 Tax=Frankliniella fusca TaxID=407009 RepID=A0AAE1I4Z2_9NEOP|nr:hypothetical protein KUF71_013723 [Frankliniella fusca]
MTRHDHITEFYLHQAGGGQYYAGSSYQKGHGIGSWLGGLFRTVLPLLKSGATAVGREAARAGAHVLADVASGDTFADSAKRHTGEAVQNLKRKAASAMNGSGRAIKRPKPAPKRHTVVMAFMHSASVEALPTELSLWLSSATQMGEERSQWIMVSPLANFDSATTIELEVAGVGYAYADPAHMLLYTKEKIVNADGSDITDADNSDATLAAKETHLQQRMWHEDTPGHHDSLDSNQNLGLAWRRSRTKLSREFEMMGPLHLDICNTDRLLLNNCTLRLKLTRSRDAFALMSTKGTEKIKLLDVKLFIRRVTISPSVLLAHAQALEKSAAKYPVNRVDIKTVTIAQGMHSKTIDNLFLNQLPQRVIIGFVDNRAFNEDYARNPFRFQRFSLNYLQMHVDGQPVPSQPLTPDFSKDLYMEC